ncbi:MAG: hypothetical protein IT292_02095 [Deltaproteobacteria bacterium]|nr:hypothetical protein [Deltaproteobacteria bacterium]
MRFQKKLSLSWLLLTLALVSLPLCAIAQETEEPTRDIQQEVEPEEDNDHSIAYTLLMYLPNRVLDAFDIVRARVRVGPGVAIGVRLTDVADFYLGSYVSIWAGLPGPRQRQLPRLPLGLESYNGVEISLAKATTGVGMDPAYSFSEVGISLQPLFCGFDVGFDPWEIVDFVGGIFFLDLADDDY